MKNNLLIIDEKSIKNKMYYIRNQYVMIDSDLAEIYGYTTKAFNQQVQRNIERFEEDFRFELTKEEYYQILRSQNVTFGFEHREYSKYLPYAFTEQGIYMLMTVLKGDLATKQSKALIRIFKEMKDYLISNNLLNQNSINNMVLKHDNEINYINEEMKLLQDSFDKLEDKRKNNQIFFNGQFYDAYSNIIDIFRTAKEEIIIIDSYADKYTLDLISKLKVKVTLITTNKLLSKTDINNYNKQYNNLNIIYDNTFHDRYFIIDENIIYHCGTSLNYIGNKTFSINILDDKEIKDALLNKIGGLK